MKLQGASILDLVTELLIRLDAQGKEKLVTAAAPALAMVLEECGHDALDCFTRMIGPDRAKVAISLREAAKEIAHAGNDRLQPKHRSERGRR